MVYNIETMREIIKIVEVKYNLGKIKIIECDMFACEPKEKIIYIAKDDEDEEVSTSDMLTAMEVEAGIE